MRSPSLPHRSARARGPLALCPPFAGWATLSLLLGVAHALSAPGEPPPPKDGTTTASATTDVHATTGDESPAAHELLTGSESPAGQVLAARETLSSAPTDAAGGDGRAAAPSPASTDDGRTTPAPEPAPWVVALRERLATTSSDHGEVGLYVRHLGTGAEFSWLADETWYLASGVKVPVAVAVLRRTDRGLLGLDAAVELQAADFVDGTGHTNRYSPGALLRVDYLLEQMLVYSDNTASDALIREVGLDEVRGIARELSGSDFAITTLADVRRKVYGGLHDRAARLGFEEWVELRRTSPDQRVAHLRRLIGVSPADLMVANLDDAYHAYYAQGHNSGTLRAYGALLAGIAEGKALSPEGTEYLLEMMSRIRTGQRRLRATLPERVSFAHKTGTQHRRQCDLGVAVGDPSRRATSSVVIAACARGFRSLGAAERALRRVGSAVNASGIWDVSPHELRRDDAPTNLALSTIGAGPTSGASPADDRAPDRDAARQSAHVDLSASAP